MQQACPADCTILQIKLLVCFVARNKGKASPNQCDERLRRLAVEDIAFLCRFVQGYDERDPKTHKGYNLRKISMGALYKEYGLDPMTVDFIGHAIALHRCHSPSVRRSTQALTCLPIEHGQQGPWL